MVYVADVRTSDDLRTALNSLKKRKHLSLDAIAERSGVAKSTLSEFLSGKTALARWSTIELWLTACGVTGAEFDAWRHAYERVEVGSVGESLSKFVDPFELEVHRPITMDNVGELAPLPPYVVRSHDIKLAEVVENVCGGTSAMVVLVAGSSVGKTRALWEALGPLRDAGGWRLWHPVDPTRRDALNQLDRVGPRTVVWLNETQEYLFDASGHADERIAVMLHNLVTDSSRTPILVLGTLWPEYHRALRQTSASQVARLLDNTLIEVADRFTADDVEALRRESVADPRLAMAFERAEDRQITQYLAGGPELMSKYRFSCSPAAKAIIDVAADAIRMGHRNCLPYGLLRDAALDYLSGVDRDRLGDNWLEQALDETGEPCKGTRGPLTRVHSLPQSGRSGRRSRAVTRHSDLTRDDGAMYQLADYLDQYCREQRAGQIPPIGFWEAVGLHSSAADQYALGHSAWNRGLYRDAAQLWMNSTKHGDKYAATELVRALHSLNITDDRPIVWAVEQVSLNDVRSVAHLIEALFDVGATGSVKALIRRAVLEISLDNAGSVAVLVEALHETEVACPQ